VVLADESIMTTGRSASQEIYLLCPFPPFRLSRSFSLFFFFDVLAVAVFETFIVFLLDAKKNREAAIPR